jgi:sphingomyelin phosphodiesterase acid-like 3
MGSCRPHAAALGIVIRVVAACVIVVACSGVPLRAYAAQPWLFVNDVHLNPRSHDRFPITYGGDTNAALLTSTIAEMHRLAPNPPVIVMAGDFLAHHIKNADAIPTIVSLAKRFNRAFPRAQFVMALGNEDSPCGDYAMPPNSAFLRAAAAAWAPLVNRRGAAPDFVRTFSRDGFYTARLPLPGIRAVVVDNAFWSPLYRDACDLRTDPTPASFDELRGALSPAGTQRRWLVMHIPPGIDAGSTMYLVHHLAIVPFMRPSPRDAVLALIADPARRIEVVVTGHVHRLAYRIVDRTDGAHVPLLISPAVSPILGNRPSFLTAEVGSDGVIRSLEEHTLVHRHWRDLGGLGTLGVSEFSGAALVNLQRRLERDPGLREKFATLYSGDARYPDMYGDLWRPYVCAATAFNSTAFRDCLDEGGFSFLTRRGVAVAGVAVAAVVLVAGAIIAAIVVARRRGVRAVR